MRVGVPREIKPGEHRVGLTPTAVREYAHQGHEVFVEKGAGLGAGDRQPQRILPAGETKSPL